MKAAAHATRIGKAELAKALRWSRPKLDRRLDEDANFPVIKRGQRGGGWEFELAAVLAYLGQPAAAEAAPMTKVGKRKVSRRRAAVRPARAAGAGGAGAESGGDALRITGFPAVDGAGVHHRGESTAAQRLKNAQAAQAEDKLRVSRRELVEAEEMRMVLGTMLAHLGKGLEGLPDTLVRRLGLKEEDGQTMRELIDDLRRNMVADLHTLLA
jgi:phage terminase Nu1 subunit (DNA packaging protein)